MTQKFILAIIEQIGVSKNNHEAEKKKWLLKVLRGLLSYDDSYQWLDN